MKINYCIYEIEKENIYYGKNMPKYELYRTLKKNTLYLITKVT